MQQHLLHIEEVGSTNEFLKDLLKKGSVQAPFCVVTDHQTEGKGQRGNVWESEKGLNLTASFLVGRLPKELPVEMLNVISAISILRVLIKYGIHHARVKWPNDIFIADLKLAGILTENYFEGSRLNASIVGIGINVNQADFPEELKACSLYGITGRKWDIQALLFDIYNTFYGLLENTTPDLMEELNGSLYKAGREVTFSTKGEYKEYKIVKMLANGKLAVLDKDREIELEHHQYKWVK